MDILFWRYPVCGFQQDKKIRRNHFSSDFLLFKEC